MRSANERRGWTRTAVAAGLAAVAVLCAAQRRDVGAQAGARAVAGAQSGTKAAPATEEPRQAAEGREAAHVTPVREADRVCAECHAAIFARYVTTPMANGSGAAAEHVVAGAVRHARSGVSYAVGLEAGEPTLRYRRDGDGVLDGARSLAYFLGSGNLGTTYLYRQDGYLLESPVAFYTRLKGYDMAPGLTGAEAMPAALPMTRGCMRCHMSDVQAPTAGSRDHFAGLPFLHGGITCEACHGDAGAHVRSGGKAAVANPAKMDAAARDSVCISCHLEGDVSVERKGRSVYEYRPGGHMAEYLTHFVFARDSTSRSVSETEQLEVSRCKRASGDRMSCMSCHDAHGDPGPAERVAFYRAKCLACHGETAFVQTHFAETPDCTGCHMPKGGAMDTPHVAWTDHRIRRRPETTTANAGGGGLRLQTLGDTGAVGAGAGAGAADAGAGGAGGSAPGPVFAGTAVSERDLALAMYKAMDKGHPELAAEAWRRLAAAKAADPADAPVLMALGAMQAGRGQAEEARTTFAEAVRLQPESYEGANDLATLLARAGKWPDARALWERAFAVNEDVDALGLNLAAAQCATGEREKAIATLRRVLQFSPDLPRARERLREVEADAGHCGSQGVGSGKR